MNADLAIPTQFESVAQLGHAMTEYPQAFCPLEHRVTPGLYARQITMPKGVLVVSRVHRTEHPYVVSKGAVSVWTEKDGWVLIKAPFAGITKPGTCRVLVMHEDTIWTTFHVTDKTDPDEIVNEISYIPEKPLNFPVSEARAIMEDSPCR
jgi:hypothetical protein